MVTPIRQENRPRFGQLLRSWRLARKKSQLELAGDAKVSARHISFLETGRARPSREMVRRLASALEIPLREQNLLFLSAGFAPPNPERDLEDPELAPALRGIQFLLDSHEPFPAFVVDRTWNVVRANECHRLLLRWLLPGGADARETNILRLVMNPQALRPAIANWEVVAALLLQRLDLQLTLPQADEALESLREELLSYPGAEAALKAPLVFDQRSVLVPIDFETRGTRLSWFSTLARFGSAVDLTLQEVTIEALHPASPETARRARELRVDLEREQASRQEDPCPPDR